MEIEICPFSSLPTFMHEVSSLNLWTYAMTIENCNSRHVKSLSVRRNNTKVQNSTYTHQQKWKQKTDVCDINHNTEYRKQHWMKLGKPQNHYRIWKFLEHIKFREYIRWTFGLPFEIPRKFIVYSSIGHDNSFICCMSCGSNNAK